MHDSQCLESYVPTLLNLLISQTSHEEEAIRSIVAECVGRLFVVYALDMEKVVYEGFNSGNPKMIATLAKSFKYSAISQTD